MAFSGSQITRLGLYGATRGLYGSFAGKTESVETGPPIGMLQRIGVGR